MDGIVALAADVVDFPLPLLGIVDGLVLKEHFVAYEDGRGANLKVRCRGRGHGGNLLGDGGCAGIIGHGQGDGVGAYLQESGRGVGSVNLLGVGAGHGPLIGGVDGVGAVDETERLTGGQVVLCNLKVGHGHWGVSHADSLNAACLFAVAILGYYLHIVISGLVEGQVGRGLRGDFVLLAVDNPFHAGGTGRYDCREEGGSVGIDRLVGNVDAHAGGGASIEQTVVDDALDAVGIAYYGVVAAGIVTYAEVAVGILKGVTFVVEHQVGLDGGGGNL